VATQPEAVAICVGRTDDKHPLQQLTGNVARTIEGVT
jgi:hypothetical protein